jgi:hypothetical protein
VPTPKFHANAALLSSGCVGGRVRTWSEGRGHAESDERASAYVPGCGSETGTAPRKRAQFPAHAAVDRVGHKPQGDEGAAQNENLEPGRAANSR